MDYIYERFKTPEGVKIEAVTGGSRYSGKVWREIAMQIYCENGKDDYRNIGHFPSGAPFIYGEDERISVSHTDGCLVVATIPVAPDSSLGEFSPATALGVDVEKADRGKAVELRARFLNESELSQIPADSVEDNIIAWTAKEAMLKAFMKPNIDWKNNIVITRSPAPDSPGKGFVKDGDLTVEFNLYTLAYEGYFITYCLAAE